MSTIPARIRARLYTAFGLIGLGLGGTQVGYSAAGAGQPTWLTVTLAVFGFVAAGFGYTARANTPTDAP